MAASAYTDTVQKVYIAYYGRAADPVGLAYWSKAIDDAGGSLDAIMTSFGTSAEATTLYGSLTNSAKVNAIYQQSFGRDADFSGLMYYSGQLSAGTMTASSIAQNIFDGATGTDATTLTNKLAVAKAYTTAIDAADEVVAYAGTVAADAARKLLGTVDSTTTASGFDVDTSIAAMVTAANVVPKTAAEIAAAAKVISDAADVAAAKVITDAAAAVVAADVAAAKVVADAKVLSDAAVAKAITDAAAAKVITDAAAAKKVLDDAAAKVISDAAAAANADTIYTLTTAADTGASFTAGTGTDQFVGVMGTGATLGAGDYLRGGAGTDSLTVSITGSTAQSVAGVVLNDIETIDVQNYLVGASIVGTINLAQASGVTAVNVTGSSANGGTVFTAVPNVVDTTMSNGSANVTMTYTDAAVVSTTDSATVTLAGQTAGSYIQTAATSGQGVETLSVVSSVSKNTVPITDIQDALSTINISGDQALVSTLDSTALRTVDGSAATGALTLTSGVTGDMTITGGTADDKITFTSTSYTLDDTVDGGAGADTLKIGTAITAATGLKNVSNVETLEMSGGADVTLAKDANVMNFDFTDAGSNTLTLNTGVTAAATVKVGETAADVVVNSANVALTVNGSETAVDLAATITGGTGTDIINITADTHSNSPTATALASTITLVDTINFIDGGDAAIAASKLASGKDASITTGAYATALTIDASGFDAAITDDDASGVIDDTDESAEKLTVDGALASAALTITGGAAGDTITGGTVNDIIDGGAGNDTITGTAGGNDNIKGGAGDDTINMGGALTASDTIDGGAGADKLIITSLSAAALANVTNVETLAFNGTGSLATNLSFTAVDLSNGTSTDSVTFATGYTNATTVSIDAGDTVINNAKIAMDVSASSDDLGASTTITGNSASTDVLNVTASSSTVSTSAITLVNAMTVVDNGDAASGTKAAGEDITINLASYATALTIDASALDVGTFTAAGAANADNETLTITGTSAKALTITAGGGQDTLIGSSDAATGDTLKGGASNDTFTMAANLGYQDVIDGGAGTDVITVSGSTVGDVAFMATSNVETLTVDHSSTSTVTLSSYFTTAGITTVNLDPTNVSTVSATGTTSGVTYVAKGAVNDVVAAGTAGDTFKFSGTLLTANDQLDGGAGTDTVSLDNSGGSVSATSIVVDDTGAASKIAKVEQFVVLNANGGDTAGSLNADAVSITFADTATDAAYNTIVDGSVITDTNDIFTADASAVTDAGFFTTFSITGGAAADVLKGGNGADTIIGGGGADAIDGGVGADTLTGGAGKDAFSYVAGDSTTSKRDAITDFVASSDSLNITMTASNDNFDLTDKGDVASNSAGLSLLSSTTTFGEYFFNTANNTFVQDTDGNGLIQSSDTVITLTGATGLASADVNFTVTGGASANTITVGAGDDTIIVDFSGQGDSDTMTGGAGADTLQLNGSGSTHTFNSDANLAGIETISNGAGAGNAVTVVLTNQTEAFAYTGGTGIDTVTVGAGTYTHSGGGTATDVINVGTGVVSTIITGDATALTVTGSTAVDTFTNTGGGVVTFTGAGGIDSYTGKTGVVDTISYAGTATAANATNALAFEAGTGGDKIQLSDTLTSAAGGTTAGTALVLTALGAGGPADTANVLLFDTIANLGALGVTIGNESANTTNDHNFAIASDTGQVFYDADGNWTSGSVQIGLLTLTGTLLAANFEVIA